MKLIEKLAMDFVEPFTVEGNEVPLNGYAADTVEAAYIVGFRKAREMSAEIVHRMNGGDEDLVYRTIDGLGESEAE